MVLKGMNVQRPIAETDTGASTPDYDTDFHAWLMEQATRLAARDTDALDWDNLAEEIESLGRSQKTELESRINTVLVHLLKLNYGLTRDPSFGWMETIFEQRGRVILLLKDSPSLKPLVADRMAKTYPSARRMALLGFERYEADRIDHYRAVLPTDCPYTVEQLLDEGFFPEPDA
jgi:hypothetical protein